MSLHALQTRLLQSRFLTLSALLHLLLVATIGGTVLFERYDEPVTDFVTPEGMLVTAGREENTTPSPTVAAAETPSFQPTLAPAAAGLPPVSAITSAALTPATFSVPKVEASSSLVSSSTLPSFTITAKDQVILDNGMPLDVARGIKSTSESWQKPGSASGPGTSMRPREFEFTAFLAKYAGGDWDSTVDKDKSGKITGGSLPNLLYVMGKLSKDKIKADPQAIPLDLASDALIAKKPPFVFFTGHRDFKLTDAEVANLRKYIQLGGCVWGDSSLPGKRSRFDLAFRREMKRVVPDVDKDWEPLPPTHDIFSRNPAKVFYTDIAGVPPGLNYYAEPVYCLKIYGEIAILYTANDYGDMWQFALNEKGEFDTRKDEYGRMVAMNQAMYARRDLLFRNINPQSVFATYKFGTNLIVHLLTRWEDKVRNVPKGL